MLHYVSCGTDSAGLWPWRAVDSSNRPQGLAGSRVKIEIPIPEHKRNPSSVLVLACAVSASSQPGDSVTALTASSCLVLENSRHAGFQVIKVMAVEEPSPGIVGGEFNAHRLAGRDVHGVLKR
jgi:hypothetical protein